MLNSLFKHSFKGRKRTKRGDEKMTAEKSELPVRPTVVSITSVIIFLSGFALTVAATILGVAMMYIPPLSSIFVIATIFCLVAGPLFILSGYNLWKMKKWAAQLAATILLLDLISTPFIHLSAPFLGIGIGWIADIIMLVLIALAWKYLRNENLPH
jgi:hypothetical protein